MSMTEIVPAIQSLPRAEKLRLLQFLVVDLAREEGIPIVEAGTPYPVWTPLDAYGAAATLLEAVEAEEAKG
jgi:hypothetical protein